MFGILRHAACRMAAAERHEWVAHVCGLCLALRAEHGQLARLTTNYDAALLSVLYEAQASLPLPRVSHSCPLRRGVRAEVVPASQPGARMAAAVSTLIGGARLNDHLSDGEGWPRHLPALARGLARRWQGQGQQAAAALALPAATIIDQTQRQAAIERQPAQTFAYYAAPTELAVAAAFGHTAVLAQRPANVASLEQIGRMYGRIMFLLDSYRDYAADVRRGAFNALASSGPPEDATARAQATFRHAHAALVEAFGRLDLARPTLAHTLLVDRLAAAGAQALGLHRPGGACLTEVGAEEGAENTPEQPAGRRSKAARSWLDDYCYCNGDCCECCHCCECADCCNCNGNCCDCDGGCDGGCCDCNC